MSKDSSRGATAFDVRLDGLTQLLLIALIIGGVVARVHDFGYPDELTWDEHHFVENARNILATRSDWNDHPPLGKLLLAIGIRALGDEGAGWRAAPLLLGLALIALAFALCAATFRSRMAGLYASAFIAASGFVMAFSKTALLDGMLATSMVAAALALWCARTWRGLAVGAALVGLSMSIKFTGVVLMVPLALVIVLRWSSSSRALAAFVLSVATVVIVYTAQFSIGLFLAGDPHGIVDVADKTVGLLQHHIGLDDWKHSATSRWYTWFIPLRAVRLFHAHGEGVHRMLTTRGNPVLWWGVNASVLWAAFACLRGLRGGFRAWFVQTTSRGAGSCFLLMLWFLPLCPWIFTNRDSYIYHYLPSYTFGLVLFGGLASTLRSAKLRFALVAVVTLVFTFAAPIWSKIPFHTDSLLHALMFR